MRVVTVLLLGLSLSVAACSLPAQQQARYEVECRTHARTATFTGSPDEQGFYLECMKLMGQHELVVRESP